MHLTRPQVQALWSLSVNRVPIEAEWQILPSGKPGAVHAIAKMPGSDATLGAWALPRSGGARPVYLAVTVGGEADPSLEHGLSNDETV